MRFVASRRDIVGFPSDMRAGLSPALDELANGLKILLLLCIILVVLCDGFAMPLRLTKVLLDSFGDTFVLEKSGAGEAV